MPRSIFSWDDFKLLMQYPHLIGHLAGFKDLTPLHSHWIKLCHDSKSDVCLMASRASYKSTAVDIIGQIYSMIKYPDSTTCIIRKTITASSEVVKAVRDISETPVIYELMRFAYFADADGNVPSNAEWHYKTRKDGKIDLSVRQSVTPECTFEALGLDSKITGRHYDAGICDDVVDINDRLHSVEREYTKLIIAEVRSNVIKKTGHTAVVGTKWFSSDLFSVLEQEGIPMEVYPWQMLPFIPPEAIEKARKSQTPAMFACNYELRYDSGADCLFKDPHMGSWDHAHNTNVICHVDPAFGGDDANGISILAKMPNGKINVVGWRKEGHVKELIPFIFQKMKFYGAKDIYMEKNSDKGYTLDAIMEHPLASSYGIWPHEYTESMNKQLKISTILYDRWDHLQFAEDTDPNYLAEIGDWSNATKDHDDCADSLASGLMQGGFAAGCMSWRNLYK